MDKKNKSSFSLFNVEWDFPVLTDEEIASIEYALARSLLAWSLVFIKRLEKYGLIKL